MVFIVFFYFLNARHEQHLAREYCSSSCVPTTESNRKGRFKFTLLLPHQRYNTDNQFNKGYTVEPLHQKLKETDFKFILYADNSDT